jgi:hypothetical protein
MKNRWVSYKDPVGSWTITLPSIEGKQNFHKLLEYMTEFLALGEEEKVFTVKHSRMGSIGAPNLPYLEQVKWSADERGILPFFTYINGAGERNGYTAATPGQLAYYNKDGAIVVEDVSNLGSLLKTLNDWKDENRWSEEIHFYANPFPPVSIFGYEVSNEPYNKPIVSIWLQTDIWFPKLVDFLKFPVLPHGQSPNIVENKELANIHTPRLNRFLASIHKLSLKYGATWRLDKPEYLYLYQDLLLETGIKLDS